MFLCKFPFWSYTRVEDGSDSLGDGSVWNNHWSSINRFALKFRKTTVAPPSHDTPGSGGYLKGIISPHLSHYQTYSNKFSVCHSLPFGDGRGRHPWSDRVGEWSIKNLRLSVCLSVFFAVVVIILFFLYHNLSITFYMRRNLSLFCCFILFQI